MTQPEFQKSVGKKVRYIATQPRDERDAWILAAHEVNIVERFAGRKQPAFVDARTG
jgi:hypothetical protein